MKNKLLEKKKLKNFIKLFVFWVKLILALSPFLFIFFWMILSSLKNQFQNISYPPLWIFKPTLSNYVTVFRETPFLKYFMNSMIISGGATLIGLFFGVPAAYAIAQFKRKGIALLILILRIAPGIMFLLPCFILFTRLGLIDTYPALIFMHLAISLPVVVWLTIGGFEEIPLELKEAAYIDGCSKIVCFLKLELPLTKSFITIAGLMSFIFCWNYFIFALVLSQSITTPLPVAVFNFVSYETTEWGPLAAASILITLPPAILMIFIHKGFIKSFLTAGIKG